MRGATITQSASSGQSQLVTRDFVARDLERLFRQCFALAHDTVLRGGAEEPFYRARGGVDKAATIFYRGDYFRSALHEVAHWCVAGMQRRQLDDFGYWYAPDGRTVAQQEEFERVEVLPQAWEMIFCAACGHSFSVSRDNLDNGSVDAVSFERQVYTQAKQLLVEAPQTHRAMQWSGVLSQYYRAEKSLRLVWLRQVLNKKTAA